jgi:hypothetical protein
MAFQPNAFQNNDTGNLKAFQVRAARISGGGAIVATSFSRRRWDELQALIAAEEAARERALQMQASAEQAALKRAADEAAAVIAAARQVERIRGETAAIDRVLMHNAVALRDATRAENQSLIIYEANSAIQMSRQLTGAIEDETDEMIHLLLLS